MGDADGMVAPGHVVVRLLALGRVGRGDLEVVVAVEEHEALDQEVLPVLRLPLQRVVDVALADAEEDHLVRGIDAVRSEEVVL